MDTYNFQFHYTSSKLYSLLLDNDIFWGYFESVYAMFKSASGDVEYMVCDVYHWLSPHRHLHLR